MSDPLKMKGALKISPQKKKELETKPVEELIPLREMVPELPKMLLKEMVPLREMVLMNSQEK